jgi:Secretion system C-terminal sorting domain
MKKLYILLFTILITSLSFGQVISEFEPNPVGGDPAMVSFELNGTPNAGFTGWVLSIESDPGGSNPGLVDRATMVTGTFDANGILVVMIPDLENPSFTVVLVSTFTGAAGATDVDTNNDGILDDISAFGTVHDAIGVPDNVGDELTIYGVQLGGSDFKYTGDEPRIVFRDGSNGDLYAVNDVTHDSLDQIFNINGIEVMSSDFDFNPADGTTFGTANPANNALSTKERKIEGFNLYPNPTSKGFVNISSNNGAAMKVTVFDVLGKQVINQMVSNKHLDVSKLNVGVYIMRVIQDNAFITKKLVIK